ncbi:S-4TM family putative pore-forming effector [Pseudarthrobacter raffinosi]|uniref:S-4TM family putative pore-forming effector n=1 Tax=Pseudarthrobacter raffinosi TaxID=2953651 RepID=UPI00208E3279|nr:S-4TM family putative pore-forming effector [Pseudarthrobacter sp. MDT3-28]MCO4239814.1 S-4TM family putative pore-forming effector [Pseudarthrobacter sp. MDT3-28]
MAQNTDHSQRLLAAQSRLYTDAKRIHDGRVIIVVLLAVVTIAVALAVPEARQAVGATGGALTFLWSVLGSSREKRRRREAVSVQEEFDTNVFDIPTNEFAIDRPSPTLIAEAAARYKGNRTKDWYPDPRPVARPLDVLICQRSNLGWGSSVHRYYAACLTAGLLALIFSGFAVAAVAGLSMVDALVAVLVPLLSPARELIEAIRANHDSADMKAKAESKVLRLWQRGLEDHGAITAEDCRSVQDRILQIRQTNAHVPDWLDNLRRSRNETVMHESAQHLIEDAIQHGRTT